jgi:uncharacterized protein YndB with AHSA1/START domain
MPLSRQSIEPVRKERRLPVPAEEAFRLFTEGMGRWWPLATHSIAGDDAAGIRFEKRTGGQVVELTTDGTEHSWADVLTWEPPDRLVLSWHPTVEIVASSTIDVRFEAVPGGCLLQLEHRDWEAFGERLGTELRAGYDPGWDVVLAPYEAHAKAGAAGGDRGGAEGGPA